MTPHTPQKPSPSPDKRSKDRRTNPDRRHHHHETPDFQAMIEGAAHGILVHRNFKPLYANAMAAQVYGYTTPDDVMALPLLRPLIPTDAWAKAEADYDDLVHARRQPIIGRARAIRHDGQEIWLSITERVITWAGRAAVQLTFFDITHHVQREQTLLSAEQHLRSVLEILPYPIYITRIADGQLLFVNRKTCLLFQQSAGQLLKSFSGTFFVNPNDREELRQLLDTIPDIRDVEVMMKTAQGREFMAEIAAIKMDYAGQSAVLVALNDISARKEMEAELFRQASTDALTSLANRRHFMNLAEQEVRRAHRFGRPLTIMMLDLDHFKKINDTYGHGIGDSVLRETSRRAGESLRQSDVMGRLGGEEFAVLLPETDMRAARDVAERLRQHLAEQPIMADHTGISCTVSIGLAALAKDDSSIDHVLERADHALYRAKKQGRNRVEIEE